MFTVYYLKGVSFLRDVVLNEDATISNGSDANLGIVRKFAAFVSTLSSDLVLAVDGLGVLCVIICAIGYMVSNNPQTAEKFKSWGFRIFFALAVIFSAQIIVTTVKGAFTNQ